MLLSRERGFVFIHVYKNAGTSITRALRPFATPAWQLRTYQVLKKLGVSSAPFDPHPFPAHITASELIDIMGRETFDTYFSFAVVRNPWDWQVSLYKYMLKETNHHQHQVVKDLGSFDNYIRWRCAEEVRFQKDFIFSENDELLVDFVGKYETLEDDFGTICAQIGISTALPRLNVSNTRPYHQYYTEATRELVRHTFAPDIALFGYEFMEDVPDEMMQLQ